MCRLEPVISTVHFQHVPYCAVTALASNAVESYIYLLNIKMLAIQIMSFYRRIIQINCEYGKIHVLYCEQNRHKS